MLIGMIPLAVLLFISPANAGQENLLAKVDCQVRQKLQYRISMQRCEYFCPLIIRLYKKNIQIAEIEAEGIQTPGGSLDESYSQENSWSVNPTEKTKDDLMGNAIINISTVSLEAGVKGILISSTKVPEAEGLPVANYELYMCSPTALRLIWSGNDDGSGAMAEVKVIARQDIDEIEVKTYGSGFDATPGGRIEHKTAAIFAWDSPSQQMKNKISADP